MVVFDIDGKKVLKVSLQMEIDALDKKIARVLTAREELHQAICDLFNAATAEFERRDIRLQSPALRRARTLRRISMSKLRHRLPLPLEIDCNGFSKKLIRDLADQLSLHFVDVQIDGTDIIAANPLNMKHYAKAWDIIDRFGVKAR